MQFGGVKWGDMGFGRDLVGGGGGGRGRCVKVRVLSWAWVRWSGVVRVRDVDESGQAGLGGYDQLDLVQPDVIRWDDAGEKEPLL